MIAPLRRRGEDSRDALRALSPKPFDLKRLRALVRFSLRRAEIGADPA